MLDLIPLRAVPASESAEGEACYKTSTKAEVEN